MPSQNEMAPIAAITIPAILFSMINCFRRNFFLNVLMLVLKVNHHKAEPVKIPQRTVSMTRRGSTAESAMLNLTAVNIARIRNIDPGFVIVMARASTKSSTCLLFLFFCLICLTGFVT